MRQVPKKFFSFHSIFSIILLDEIALTIGFPILTFLCFDSRSLIFSAHTAYATRSFWYGILSALPHFMMIIFAPLLCIFSDSLGRKKMLGVGILSVIGMNVAIAYGTQTGLLFLVVLGSLIAGFCGRIEPIALTMIGDLYNTQNKLSGMSYLQFFISVGACLGPILGGYFADHFFFHFFNFALPFWIASLLGVIALVINTYMLKETCSTQIRSNIKIFSKEKFALLKNRNILYLAGLLVCTQVGWRMYYQFMPPFLKISFHYGPHLLGLFIGLIAVWLSLASFFVTPGLNMLFSVRTLQKTITPLLFISLACNALLCLLSPTLTHAIWIWIIACPIAASDVIIYSIITTLLSENVSIENQGFIMGMNFFLVCIVWVLMSLLGGWLAAKQITAPLIFAPLGMLGLWIITNRYFANPQAQRAVL